MKFTWAWVFGLGLLVVVGAQGADKVTVIKKKARQPQTQTQTIRSTQSAAIPAESVAGSEKVKNLLKGMQVRPLIGVAFMNPKEFNNKLMNVVDNKASAKVGNAFTYGLALEYPVYAGEVYAGLRIEHFNASGDSVNVNKNGQKYTASSSVAGTPVMMTGSYLYSVAPAVRLGGMLGAGLALGYHNALDIESSNDSVNLPAGTISYGSTPFVGLVAATGEYSFTQAIGVRLEAGYRSLSSDQLKATDDYGKAIKSGDVLVDAEKKNINVDASGFYTGLALAITL